MTTGSIISDKRSLDEDVYSGSGQSLYGSYFEKTWTGGDRVDPKDLTPHNYIMRTYQSYVGRMIRPSGHIASPISGYGWGSPPAITWDSNDTLKLYAKLGSKIRDHDFNSAVFLAEADQSLALIGETATRLAKFLGSLKSGNVYKAASFIAGDKNALRKEQLALSLKKHFRNRSAFDDRKALANAVLEVQYGWRPMLSDAYDAGVAAATMMSKSPRESFKARRKIHKSSTYSNGPVKWTTFRSISQQLIAVVSAPPSWQSQLRLNNPLQAITNRTPWLFVANWFIPFETYLDARSAYTDLNIVSLLLTRKDYTRAVFSDQNGTEAWYKDFTFERKVLPVSGALSAASALPLPSLKPIEKSLGWEHVLNGLALLNGSVKRYRD